MFKTISNVFYWILRQTRGRIVSRRIKKQVAKEFAELLGQCCGWEDEDDDDWG